MHQWVSNEDEIETVATDYFQQLFTTTNPYTIDESRRLITATVTEEMNQRLLCLSKDEEIREATFAINPEKASGPDGMTSFFINASGARRGNMFAVWLEASSRQESFM